MVEDGHEIFLLGTGTYVDKRANATLTATRSVVNSEAGPMPIFTLNELSL